MMRKILFSILLGLTFLPMTLRAQVEGVSINVSPMLEYTWWGNKMSLTDAPLYGARVGFGLGKYFEIRGLYARSFDTQGVFRGTDWTPLENLADKLPKVKVLTTRWGGELKGNIGRIGFFAPYVTLGGGIQAFSYDRSAFRLNDYKENQLYASLGLGTKFNLTDRVALTFEAKNTAYNVSNQNNFLKPEYAADPTTRIHNWSAVAGLDIYLGGRRPEPLDRLGRAYFNKLTDGFRGAKFVVEPGMAYIDFSDKSAFNDTYLIGAAAGFDFSKLIGVRAFYYQPTKEGKLDYHPNGDMAMYGGYLLARLNYLNGITPFMNLGAGYMNVKDQYLPKRKNASDLSGYFAMAGLGLDVPISRFITLFGSANILANTNKDELLDEPLQANDLKLHKMYTAGIRFNFGLHNQSPTDVYDRQITKELASRQRNNDRKIQEMQEEYIKQLAELNDKIDRAYAERDTVSLLRLMNEKQTVNENKKRVEEARKKGSMDVPESVYYRLTPEDFERLLEKATKEVQSREPKEARCSHANTHSSLPNATPIIIQSPVISRTRSVSEDSNVLDGEIIEMLSDMKRQNQELTQGVRDLERTIVHQHKLLAKERMHGNPTYVVVESDTVQIDIKDLPLNSVKEIVVKSDTIYIQRETGSSIQEVKEDVKNAIDRASLDLLGYSAFIGLNIGKSYPANLGVRADFYLANNFTFSPELFLSANFRDFGLSGNFIYHTNFTMPKVKMIHPYIGAGLGLFHADKLKIGTNIILGTSFDFLGGRLFADYTSRRFFQDNQFAVGYRFYIR